MAELSLTYLMYLPSQLVSGISLKTLGGRDYGILFLLKNGSVKTSSSVARLEGFKFKHL